MARMLANTRRAQECHFGCCKPHELVAHGGRRRGRARKERRAADKRAWQRDLGQQ